jgi:hypothetical protein
MNASEKILATTTQLVEPSKIKQLLRAMGPGFQIQNAAGLETLMQIDGKKGTIMIGTTPAIAKVSNIDFGANFELSVGSLETMIEDLTWLDTNHGQPNQVLLIPAEEMESRLNNNPTVNLKTRTFR